MGILLPFSYLCETGSSPVAALTTDDMSPLNIEQELRVAVSCFGKLLRCKMCLLWPLKTMFIKLFLLRVDEYFFFSLLISLELIMSQCYAKVKRQCNKACDCCETNNSINSGGEEVRKVFLPKGGSRK